MSAEQLAAAIRDIPDFPQPGIVFKDITPILGDPDLFRTAVDILVRHHPPGSFNKIAAIESRGFLFGAAMAHRLGVGLVPIRKKGKLPHQCIEATYDLEYGTATIEMHVDAVGKGDRVLIVDDLLATGGTAAATAGLIERAGATVAGIDFVIELAFLNGRDKLKSYDVFAPVVF